jgi:hypothetical protein
MTAQNGLEHSFINAARKSERFQVLNYDTPTFSLNNAPMFGIYKCTYGQAPDVGLSSLIFFR